MYLISNRLPFTTKHSFYFYCPLYTTNTASMVFFPSYHFIFTTNLDRNIIWEKANHQVNIMITQELWTQNDIKTQILPLFFTRMIQWNRCTSVLGGTFLFHLSLVLLIINVVLCCSLVSVWKLVFTYGEYLRVQLLFPQSPTGIMHLEQSRHFKQI